MKDLISRAEKIVVLLKEAGLTVSSAESCTGGLISAAITSVAGASEVFELGITSYSSQKKIDVLGVKKETVSTYGAISRQTAREMASRVRKLAGADIGVSVTGVAGPDPSEGKAPGTVYIAIADSTAVTVQKLNIPNADRCAVRVAACEAVFDLIENNIKERKQ